MLTPVQMQPRPANANPAPRTVDTAMEAATPQVCDDMTVEVALAVMASSPTDHLLVCDEDGFSTGLVTQAQLTALRDTAAYTDHVRLPVTWIFAKLRTGLNASWRTAACPAGCGAGPRSGVRCREGALGGQVVAEPLIESHCRHDAGDAVGESRKQEPVAWLR